MEQKKKLLIICGPTATGKTALGIKLAKKFNGEIISADSRQIYRYMDIGTGKDLTQKASFKKRASISSKTGFNPANGLGIGFFDFKGVPVWLLDIVKPDYQFSVADYVKCANLVIEDIYKRGKLPIIVGGTGLYIKGLIDGIETMGIEPDWKLRKRLSNYSVAQLSDKLKKLNPQKWKGMNHSDRNNPRRLIRAIELAKSKSLLQHTSALKQKTEALRLGLTASYDELYQRIDQRVEERVKMGAVEEIKKLLDLGFTWENSVLGTTIGYREWQMGNEKWEMRNGNLEEKTIQRWKFDEHAYSRRQMTWFRKDKRIKWFDINNKNFTSEIVKLINKWYNQKVVIPAILRQAQDGEHGRTKAGIQKNAGSPIRSEMTRRKIYANKS